MSVEQQHSSARLLIDVYALDCFQSIRCYVRWDE